MNSIKTKISIFLTIWISTLMSACSSQPVHDQPIQAVSENYANSTIINEVLVLLQERYIFRDKAREAGKHLSNLVKQQYFKEANPEKLAMLLTQELQKITADKHLRVIPPTTSPQYASQAELKANFIRNLERYRPKMISGYQVMEENIGYVDMRYFGGSQESFAQIDILMSSMELMDAIIFDMRQNSGGSPVGVQYLTSYFFDEDLLLNQIYSRFDSLTTDLRTMEINGIQRPDLPLFILTSKNTFSGAEDFAYNLQSRKRAVVIGDITKGGAHPTREHALTGGFGIRIPFARAINPITGTNWEGTGVIPDIKIASDQALDKAKQLALKAVIKFRQTSFEPIERLLNSVDSRGMNGEDEQQIIKLTDKLVTNKMLTEYEVNALGYYYLESNRIGAGLTVLNANTQSFPNSAMAYNKYANGLLKASKMLSGSLGQGLLEPAKTNYKKAIEIARNQNDDRLETFLNDLTRFEADQ